MKTINYNKKMKQIFLYCCLLLIAFANSLFAQSPEILLINSNAGIEKYKSVQDEFKKSISFSIREADLADIEHYSDAKKIFSTHSDLVYCIGAKACAFANKYVDNHTPLVFSSIINWQRLGISSKNAYGVANELHSRMPIFMFRSIFPEIKKIGILYSKSYTNQWFIETKQQGGELGIEILGMNISKKTQTIPALKKLLSNADAIWLIPDPIVISEKKYLYEIFQICDTNKIPVFSYHNAFIKLGAVLSVAVDNPTIGRQAAGIATELLSTGKLNEKVQFPAGSSITLDLKKAKAYHIEYNRDSLGLVNNIIK